jgi:hypothetical protein
VQNPAQALAFALDKYPQRVEVIPVSELMMDSARGNDKRPAFVKLALPDELVKQLRGGHEGGALALLVVVPREVLERSESRILLPGEVR